LRTISRNGSKDAFTPTSIEKVFDEVSVLCEEKVKHKSIRLAMSVSPPDLLVMSREVELSQVVLNLVHNACDAVVALSERWIEVIADVKDTSVVVTITDSGSGIPEHLRDKILQPFFTTKEVGKGTGLGLSISKSIIEAHGGTLAIDTAHTNTRFVITLPILTIQNAQIA
jgi:C4-dicarboxylate-specific signal transduction histidine kinase